MKSRLAIRLLAVSSFILLPSSLIRAQGSLTPPPGAPAPTMKTLDQIEPRTPVNATTCPGDAASLYIISQPGSYYLTGHIAGVAGKNGITITGCGISLDLNGFAVKGAGGAGFEDGISVRGGDVQVMNGSITGWPRYGMNVSILVPGTGCAILTRLSSYANTGSAPVSGGFLAGEACILTDCTANENGFYGIHATRSTMVRCTARKNGGTGFSGNVSVFEHCTASANAAGFGAGLGSVFTSCMAQDNTGPGFSGAGVFTDCAARLNGTGFSVAPGSRLTRCSAKDNTGAGIITDESCAAESCSATSSGGDGIACGSYCTVLNCSAMSNAGDGIQTAGKCVIRGCLASKNGTAAAGAGIHTTGSGNRIEGNETRDNLGHGIKADAGAAGDFILSNTSLGNPVNYLPASGSTFAPIQPVATQTNPVANH